MTKPRWLRAIKRIVRRAVFQQTPASDQYRLVSSEGVELANASGWHQTQVAEKQHQAFQPLLAQMRAGQVREDFAVLAQAIRETGMQSPSILEAGCGSGYYSEVLAHQLQTLVNYTGLDFSFAMIALAQQHYPAATFLQADATQLPFANRAFDIVVNGTALMHIANYQSAIAETRRTARAWCIFHTVPVLQQRATSILQKQAYGETVLEVILNERELLSIFAENKLEVQSILPSIDYNLQHVLAEETVTKTYICRVKEA